MPYLWLRYAILICTLIGAVSFYLWGRWTGQLTKVTPIFLVLVNVAAFHLYRILGVPASIQILNLWSLLIHFQAVLSAAVVGLLLVIPAWKARTRGG